jgi:hypothetical protein
VGGEGGYGAGKGNEHILGFGYVDMHYTTFSLVMTLNMYSIGSLHISSSPIQSLVGPTHHNSRALKEFILVTIEEITLYHGEASMKSTPSRI